MKKVITAVCTATAILACSMLIPMNASAGNRNCGHNSYIVDAYLDPNVSYAHSSHQYKKGDGHNGPIYGTCYVTDCYGDKYPQCSVCGDVDYSHPHHVHLYTEHENCGLGIIIHN